jgi:hypothetical protein
MLALPDDDEIRFFKSTDDPKMADTREFSTHSVTERSNSRG